MASLKPNKPSTFDGQRDEYTVRTWLYQVKQCLLLIQVGNALNIDDATKVSFAASFFTGTAAAWWFTRVAGNTIPTNWEAFENAVLQELVPFDSVLRSRDKLRKLVQRTSVSSYLSEFRNILLTIPEMSELEQVDRFCQGLEPQIRLEVLKAEARTIIDASRIALNVDSVLWGAGVHSFQRQRYTGPTPMEIGNIEQRRKDLRNNSCFKCHTLGFRPRRCGTGHSRTTNVRGNKKWNSSRVSNARITLKQDERNIDSENWEVQR